MSLPTDNWVSNPKETHGPLTSVSCWSLVGVSFAFLALRLSVRYRSTKLWIDDLILAVSWLSLLTEVSMVQMSINLGFGKHALDIDLSHMEMIAIYGASGLTLSTIAINLSKISFGVTLLRLTTSWAKGYVWFAIATLIIFSVPAAVMPWIQCKPLVKTFVDIFPGKCIDKRPTIRFGEFQAIWAALMDFSLALIPWAILWNVQMRLTEKVGVGIAMSLGILAGSASIVRGMYLKQLTKQDISYDATKSVIWTAAESAVTIIATSIPVLRVFIKNKVGSAMGYIHNSSGRSRATSAPHSPVWSRKAPDSIQSSTVLSQKEQSLSTSKSSHLGRSTKEWIILEDTAPTHGSHGSLENP